MQPKYIWPIKVLFKVKEGNETHTHSNYYLTVEEALEAIKHTSVESEIIKATPGTECCTDWDDKKPYCYIRPLVELSPVMFSVDFYMRDWSFKDPNMVTWFRLIYHKFSTNKEIAGVLNLTQIDSLMNNSLPYPSLLVNIPTDFDAQYDNPQELMYRYINAYYIMRNEPEIVLSRMPDMQPKYILPIKVLFKVKEGNETHTHSNSYLTVEEALEAIKRTSVESAQIIKVTPGTEFCTDGDDKKPYCCVCPIVEVSPVMFSVDFYMRDWSSKDPNMVTWFRLIYHKYSTNEEIAGVLDLTQIDSLTDKSPYPSLLVNIPQDFDVQYDDPQELMYWYINAYYIMRNEPEIVLRRMPDIFESKVK